MKIIVHGLGRMGMQIARKLAEDGHTVVAHNRGRPAIEEAITYGCIGADTKEEAIQHIGDEPVTVWLMLPSDVVDEHLDQWLALVPAGSTLIDGGNSDYRKTKERNQRVTSRSVAYVDIGTSGGVWGYQNGFSMMVGGDDKQAVDNLSPILTTLAAPEGAFFHFGSSGSGHFVKMTHNAIEYGMMQSLAEGYQLLKEGPYSDLDLAAAGNVWQHHSVVTSWLNELTQSVLAENPNLDGIDGFVAESGEARWALESGAAAGIPMPSIQASFDVRIASQQGHTSFATKLLAGMRNKFGGHQINKS